MINVYKLLLLGLKSLTDLKLCFGIIQFLVLDFCIDTPVLNMSLLSNHIKWPETVSLGNFHIIKLFYTSATVK